MPIMVHTPNQYNSKTGVPPIFMNANGNALTAWSISGQTVQNGAPTPDNPIYPEFVGERTENLAPPLTEWVDGYVSGSDGHIIVASETNKEKTSPYIPVSGGSMITFSAAGGFPSGTAVAWRAIGAYTSDKTFILRDGGASANAVAFSVPENCAFVRVCCRTYGEDVYAQLNTGSTAKPYEPYGYKMPITCGSQTTPIYLGQVQTVRKIKKLVLTGEEDGWYLERINSFGIANFALSNALDSLSPNYGSVFNWICSHFEPQGTLIAQTETEGVLLNTANAVYIRVSSTMANTKDAFKQWLAAQYAAGTPVTIWYVLATPETGIVNEPLAKIGNYADTVASTNTGAPSIITSEGYQNLTVGTTIQPSSVSVAYTLPEFSECSHIYAKIPVGDGTNEVLKVYANDGRMVYDVRADVARQMAKQFDGTAATYKSIMQSFFALYNANSISPSNLTDLCRAWYKGTRDDWNGYTTFSTTSGSSSGTRGGDNAGKTCVPSTNTTAGQDDFAGLPLFYPVDVNYEVDADTKDIIITGIDGITSSFERTNSDKFVGVMQMSAYVWHSEDAVNNTFTDGYSAQPVTTADRCWMLPEAVRMDGTVREFVVHPKYMGTVVNGKLKCYSGVTPSAYIISHNTLNSYGKANGNQYSGGSVTLLGFLEIMTRIKYASLTQDGNIQGCVNYNVQSPVAAATTSKQYVLLSATNAAKYIVGSTVLIGAATTTSAPDRGSASAYSVTGRAGTIVTKITDDPDGSANKAVWFENLSAFSATGSGSFASGVTVISTFAWQNGSCDSVLGNDGSPASPSGGKYPAMIQGIEYSVGIYEVYGDMLIAANPATTDYPLGYYSFFVCKDASKRSTDITADYEELPAKLPYVTDTTAAWRYIQTMSFSNGIIVPTDCNGGSSTTFTRDSFYFMATPNARTTRERLCFGYLNHGVGGGGLSHSCGYAPSNAAWSFGGRPSCGEGFRA